MIKIKPIQINLTQVGKNIQVSTPVASALIPPHALAFATQGLAFRNREYTLSGSESLKKSFITALESQYCVSHLHNDVSPFLVNYLINKTNGSDSYTYESLLSELKTKQSFLFCGAGPSLYESLAFVRKACQSESVFVVAGGSAIKAFEANDLVPDLCLACDPQEATGTRSAGLSKEFMDSTVLLAGSGLNPSFLDHWTGPVVLTNGMSALPIGEFMEPGRVVVSEGSIGVSTFFLSLMLQIPNAKTHILGVDLSANKEGNLYPSNLGFENEVESHREHIWRLEAQAVAQLAAQFSVKPVNLSARGRRIPNLTLSAPNSVTIKGARGVLNLIKQKQGFFNIQKLGKALNELDLNNLGASPLFEPLLTVYHHIYLSKSLLTGEYDVDGFRLRINYLKDFVRNLC